jgi:uncharacterized protein
VVARCVRRANKQGAVIRAAIGDATDASRFSAFESGITFGGRRDLFAVLGHKRKLTAADYRSRYARNGLAARVVEAAPNSTWRAGVEVVEDQDPDILTSFEAAWEELVGRLNIWSVFARLDILSGLTRYAVLAIGLPGETATPAPDRFSADDIMYLVPYAEDDAIIASWNEDPTTPRFGRPETYTIKAGAAGRKTRTVTFHWSRVLHVAENMLDDVVYGTPRLERVWNDFDNLEKITGGGSEAFWLRVNKGVMFNIDKDVSLTSAQSKDLQQAIEEYAHNVRRTIATRGLKVDQLGSDVANFNNQVDALVTLIAGATGIPKRILVGSERGELASSQDEGNWDDRISERRSQHAEPDIIRAFISRLTDAGALPEPEQYEVRWPDSHSLTIGERSSVAVQWAGLNTASGGTVVTPAEIREALGLAKLEDATDEKPRPVFNGAQVQAATGIITQVANGELPRDSAVALLVFMFGLDEDDAEQLVPPEPEEPDVDALPDQLALPPGPPNPDAPPDQDADPVARAKQALARLLRAADTLERVAAGKARRPPARADRSTRSRTPTRPGSGD